MIKSMTGYGRGFSSSESGEITVELKSVNHRFRDISLKLPSRLSPIEGRVKKEVEAAVARGRVDVFITFGEGEGREEHFEVNLPLAKGYISALEKLKKELALEGDISVSEMAAVKNVLYIKEPSVNEDLLWEAVLAPLKEALSALDAMRRSEGKSLGLDIGKRLSGILNIVDSISEKQPEVVNSYREKLKLRVAEFAEGAGLDKSRLAQEVAIMADRSDITEETVRLRSHIEQFGGLLGSEEPVGRKLDFLVQEMNRETNTIGSKCSDAEISGKVVDIKAELERIREQVQNVE